MSCMEIDLITHSQQIPANLFTFDHLKPAEVTEDITLDAVHLSFLFTLRLVENHERGNELAIYVFSTAICSCVPFPGNDDWPKESEICFLILRYVRVVPPYQGIRIGWTGTALFIGIPTVRELFSRKDHRPCAGSGQIVRSFIVLIVAEPVRVHPE